ncbi:polypyrimidine tract-binding protein homolog 3 [Selaginella moellendorffii]|uniref:polypyrimidine tract-binding protein homolog 3 n=1 Tax=Selaginella moellendorffii TaxID=88036 RepID=UPI000D1D0429|nr:polypyrimidine tract-binding protein homolog 3 [Selaginella moellendorffii]|eukprot:XP_024534018.1 polypyrimidine tract-binding protein homolog 3 [Selaginella moellendorffii]
MRFAGVARSARHLLTSSRFLSSTTFGSQSDGLFQGRCFATTTLAQSSAPSKVLFFRTQADEITQEELTDLVKPFGSINKFIVMRSGKDALLEMGDVEEARSVIKHFSEDQALLRGKEVQVEYSSRQKLSEPENPKVEASRVLLAIIHNPLYQMNVDILHQVFSPHGNIEKIVIFHKAAVQAFIVFDSDEAAAAAKSALQGRQIFDGCCKLDIKFSINQNVRVIANNELTRDYTNNSLPGDSQSKTSPQASILGAGTAFSTMKQGSVPLSGVLPFGVTGSNDKCTLLVSNLHERTDEEKLFNLFSGYGRVLRIKMFENAKQALVQLADGVQAELALNFLKGAPLLGSAMEISFSKHNTIRHPRTRDFTMDPYNRFNSEYVKNCCPPSKILHISNVSDEVEEGDLLNFLAPHGVIQRVKLFESTNRRQALVEFDTIEQATEALASKHRSKLKATSLRIAFSRYHAIR